MSALLWVLLALCVAGVTSAPALPFAYTVQTGNGGKALGLITTLNGENRGYSYQVVDPNSETSVVYVEGPEARSFLERYIAEIMAIAPEAVARALKRLGALRYPASTGPLGNDINTNLAVPPGSSPQTPSSSSSTESVPNGIPSTTSPEPDNLGPTRFPNDVFPTTDSGVSSSGENSAPSGSLPFGPDSFPNVTPSSSSPEPDNIGPTRFPNEIFPTTDSGVSSSGENSAPSGSLPFGPDSVLPDEADFSPSVSGDETPGFPNDNNGEPYSDGGPTSSDPDANLPAFSGLPDNPDFLSSELGDRMIAELMNRVRSLSPSASGNPIETLSLADEVLPSPMALNSNMMDSAARPTSTRSEPSSTTHTSPTDSGDMMLEQHSEETDHNELHGNIPEPISESATTSGDMAHSLNNFAPSEDSKIGIDSAASTSPELPAVTNTGVSEAMASPELPKISNIHEAVSSPESPTSDSSVPIVTASSPEQPTSTRSGPIRIELDLSSTSSEPVMFPAGLTSTTATPVRRSPPVTGGFQMPNLARVKKTLQSIFKPLIDFF